MGNRERKIQRNHSKTCKVRKSSPRNNWERQLFVLERGKKGKGRKGGMRRKTKKNCRFRIVGKKSGITYIGGT